MGKFMLWLLIISMCIIAFIPSVWEALQPLGEESSPNIFLPLRIIIISVVLFLIWIKLEKLWVYRCPQCKKIFTMAKEGTYLTGSEEFEYVTELRQYDSMHQDTGRRHEAIAHGTREYYDTVYKCKLCGGKKTIHTTKEIKPI